MRGITTTGKTATTRARVKTGKQVNKEEKRIAQEGYESFPTDTQHHGRHHYSFAQPTTWEERQETINMDEENQPLGPVFDKLSKETAATPKRNTHGNRRPTRGTRARGPNKSHAATRGKGHNPQNEHIYFKYVLLKTVISIQAFMWDNIQADDQQQDVTPPTTSRRQPSTSRARSAQRAGRSSQSPVVEETVDEEQEREEEEFQGLLTATLGKSARRTLVTQTETRRQRSTVDETEEEEEQLANLLNSTILGASQKKTQQQSTKCHDVQPMTDSAEEKRRWRKHLPNNRTKK
ncbi:hypothetical protein OS493_038305 [Desmophyllum pertusum]|uniref:Uncharacterized protein n=1 Tax=Desmophyllum pertusum TaxID=174260 RepID=A0A9X0CUC4_9CNID|nr:hypothetical protein OS493_038305 [Desmophyllum pertusum]